MSVAGHTERHQDIVDRAEPRRAFCKVLFSVLDAVHLKINVHRWNTNGHHPKSRALVERISRPG